MGTFVWSEAFAVGITTIDQQHKRLIELVNGLFEAIESGRGSDALGEVLSGVVEYTKTHFRYEESMLKSYNYPDLAAHRLVHDGLTKKVTELMDRVRSGAASPTIETAELLKAWVGDHVLKLDKQYSEHLRSNGAR